MLHLLHRPIASALRTKTQLG
nr:unnamed protein product [Callosobruchus chinensis]